MFKYSKLAAVALIAIAAASGNVRAEDAPADPVIAKVGAVEIHESELKLAIAGLDPQLANLPDYQKRVAALSSIIDVKLLAADADPRRIVDVQWVTPHLSSLGAREVPRAAYLGLLADALQAPLPPVWC